MLKLERTKPCSDVKIKLRTKDPLLTKHFTYALLFTIGIHLLAILAFKIRSNSINDNAYSNPIVTTVTSQNTYSTELEMQLEASAIDENNLLTRLITAPEELTPQITQTLPQTYSQAKHNNMINELWAIKDFDQLEEISFHNADESNTINKKFYSPLTIKLNGELQKYQHQLNVNNQTKKIQQTEPTTQHIITFEVLLQGRPGKVFWFKQETMSTKTINEQAKKIISSIFIKSKTAIPITRGKIDLIFEIPNFHEEI